MDDIRNLFQIFTRRFGFLNKDCCNAEGHDISLVQSHILYEIERQHLPSIQQVSETLGTDITTFSRQVQTLIKMNLVKKTPDLNDRRIYLLSLTEEGQRVTEEIDRQMCKYLEQVFGKMSATEKEMVIKSIQILNKNMENTSRCCYIPRG